jgi:hypothetical protein
MVKVINISNKTIEVAGTPIRPHTGKIFQEMTIKDRQKLSAMSAVGVVRAYEYDYTVKDNDDLKIAEDKVKPTKKSNRKKIGGII